MMHSLTYLAISASLIFLLVAVGPTASYAIKARRNMALLDALMKEQVLPEVIDKAPAKVLNVEYSSGAKVNLGNKLTPTQVKDKPRFDFEASPTSLYSVVMVDPDAPSRQEPKLREILHFMQANIPGKDTSRGDVLAEYIGSGPPKDTGLHRYIFLLFEQKKGALNSSMKISKNSRLGRVNFSIRKFAQENNLGEPIAANFYQAEYDDYVPILHKQLSG